MIKQFKSDRAIHLIKNLLHAFPSFPFSKRHHVRSRDTESKYFPECENSICVTVSAWSWREPTCFHDSVSHNNMLAWSALDAWKFQWCCNMKLGVWKKILENLVFLIPYKPKQGRESLVHKPYRIFHNHGHNFIRKKSWKSRIIQLGAF